MRHVFIISLILIAALLQAQESTVKTGFARLQYDGGGDWYNDPEVLPNLAKYINTTLASGMPIDQNVVRAGDSKLYDFPFVYLTGHGNIRFTEGEVQNLRQWMLRGGFLYADDDYGMDESFRREIKRVFPERNWWNWMPAIRYILRTTISAAVSPRSICMTRNPLRPMASSMTTVG